MSQAEKIREYIEKYGSITPLEALKEIGCMRLAARIEEIERQGMALEHKNEYATNREGKKVRFTRYCKVTA